MVFRNMVIFYGEELLAPRPTPQAGGPPLVGCPLLHIRSYPPYLEAVPPSATRGRAMPCWQGPKPFQIKYFNYSYSIWRFKFIINFLIHFYSSVNIFVYWPMYFHTSISDAI
jgi:hypothetical protein